MKRPSGTGDGDVCPITPAHGRMLVVPGNRVQLCPDQSHDGPWSRDGKRPATRALWPYQFFEDAVKKYNASNSGEAVVLPDIDLGGLL